MGSGFGQAMPPRRICQLVVERELRGVETLRLERLGGRKGGSGTPIDFSKSFEDLWFG